MSLCPHHPNERMMYVIERAWAERNHLTESATRQYYACKSCMDATEADAAEVIFLWTDKPESAPLRNLVPPAPHPNSKPVDAEFNDNEMLALSDEEMRQHTRRDAIYPYTARLKW